MQYESNLPLMMDLCEALDKTAPLPLSRAPWTEAWVSVERPVGLDVNLPER